jgi:hypothetical protein
MYAKGNKVAVSGMTGFVDNTQVVPGQPGVVPPAN